MNNSELIAKIAEEAGVTQKEVRNILSTASSIIVNHIKSKGSVVFPGLGKFSYKSSAARSCRNPSTGAMMEVPAKGKVGFSASASIKSDLESVI